MLFKARLAGFGLTLHEDKTRLIEFGGSRPSHDSGVASCDPTVVRPSVVAVVSTQNGGEPPVLRSHGACMSRHASWRSAVSLRVRRFPSVLCFTMSRPRVTPQ